ncbi:magnesium-chelatase subunit ChlD [Pyrus ussuriensis x Pyrus communis]|uniref:Magnesium-chelatase subunit ChlD n=1 Tax=Pyrus ussuriensis x Pyrus communis TaxID=2448454 RepID=A0A5N5G6L0_9ROSA|nr:magnesium-chelatase subunit ChlD [Pyrus ussuriensis x Pyrus communis]
MIVKRAVRIRACIYLAWHMHVTVFIIPFRGDSAEVLLPPSRSISMARNHLERLPCGGGSPLAHGLTTDEILEVAGKIYKAGMSLLVIDTENRFVSTGFAKEIARVAQGSLSNLYRISPVLLHL